jgi:hypothetical protein
MMLTGKSSGIPFLERGVASVVEWALRQAGVEDEMGKIHTCVLFICVPSCRKPCIIQYDNLTWERKVYSGSKDINSEIICKIIYMLECASYELQCRKH